MKYSEFQKLKTDKYTHIPVSRTLIADCDTALSVYLKLGNKPYSYLLESAAQGGERWSRYSIVGLAAEKVIRVHGHQYQVELNGDVVQSQEVEDPLEEINQLLGTYRVAPLTTSGRFAGGLVGYFAYDAVRYIEHKLHDTAPPDPVGTPDILLMESRDVIVFDHAKSSMQLVTLADAAEHEAWERANTRLDDLEIQLSESTPATRLTQLSDRVEEGDFYAEFSKSDYEEAVRRTIEYIKAGDVMQVVLATRFSIDYELEPINLYRALRSLNPSPYMYFMHLDDFHIVSSSPEILARVEGKTVVNRPLAGTRRRGRDEAEDLELEQELKADAKEIAEHLMLIDLSRNDVGRVSKVGSVGVTEKFNIERYAHVMHIASHVEGELEDGKNAIDVLRATLPVGTLSGAPKIRAMEIIDELEPVKRGIYGGAVGYLAWNGNMDTAIAIRTAVVKDKRLYIEAGAGLVADSIPELEWKECLNKARSIFKAAQLASNALRLDG